MSRATVAFDHRRDAAWLTAWADGELDDAQAAAVAAHVEGCTACREEVARLRRFDLVMGSLRLREAPPEAWEAFWLRLGNRAQRGVGGTLLAAGLALVAGWGLWRAGAALLGIAALPWWVKGGALAGALGLVVLFASILRERLFARRRTRYRDVVR